MFSKTAVKALGLAALLFSQSSVANPVVDSTPPGAFAKLNRDAKSRNPGIKTEEKPSVNTAGTKTDATTFRYLNAQTTRK
jgi:hypothetical protein